MNISNTLSIIHTNDNVEGKLYCNVVTIVNVLLHTAETVLDVDNTASIYMYALIGVWCYY